MQIFPTLFFFTFRFKVPPVPAPAGLMFVVTSVYCVLFLFLILLCEVCSLTKPTTIVGAKQLDEWVSFHSLCLYFLSLKKDRLRSARLIPYFWLDFQLQISFELISKSWMICLPKISYFSKVSTPAPRVVPFSRKRLMVLKSLTIMRNSMVHSENHYESFPGITCGFSLNFKKVIVVQLRFFSWSHSAFSDQAIFLHRFKIGFFQLNFGRDTSKNFIPIPLHPGLQRIAGLWVLLAFLFFWTGEVFQNVVYTTTVPWARQGHVS